jgi:hypothetical protein
MESKKQGSLEKEINVAIVLLYFFIKQLPNGFPETDSRVGHAVWMWREFQKA